MSGIALKRSDALFSAPVAPAIPTRIARLHSIQICDLPARPWRLDSHTVPKVLVVEDDADSADVLAVALRKPGYEIECVPDGRQALFAISEQRPDVIILDLRMPVMD